MPGDVNVFNGTHCVFELWKNTSATSIMEAQWLRGRASDSRLIGPRFESCAAVLNLLASFFTVRCSSSLSCVNEYLALDSGGYV